MIFTEKFMNSIRDTKIVDKETRFSLAEAKLIGDTLGITWDKFDIEQFAMGMNVELEHGRRDPATDVTHDAPITTGKIALAHLNEIPDYYTKLAVMEQEAEGATRRPRIGDLWDTPPPTRNTLGVVMSFIIFALMFVLKVWRASKQSTSTTAVMRRGSFLR